MCSNIDGYDAVGNSVRCNGSIVFCMKVISPGLAQFMAGQERQLLCFLSVVQNNRAKFIVQG